MVKNLCTRKRVKKPNRCKKVKGCKVASGKKRTYCRKAKNKTKKTRKIRARVKSLKGGKRRSKRTKKRGGYGCAPQPFIGTPYGANLEDLPGVRGAHDGNYYTLNKLDVQPQMDPINERTTFQAIDFKGGKKHRSYKKKTRRKKGGIDAYQTPPPLRRNNAVMLPYHPMETRSQRQQKDAKKLQKGGVSNILSTIGHDFNSAYRQWQGEPVPPNPLPYEDQMYYGSRAEDNLNYLKLKIHGE